MRLKRLEIRDVVEIVPLRNRDERGYFSEIYRDEWFANHVGDIRFVQENQSFSRKIGVVRGLHFQSNPAAQGKLVRCVTGAIFDVAVDIRHGSPTFGKWVATTLTADAGNQLWIPAGFMHGFCTLARKSVVSYKVTNYYDRGCEKGVRWNDTAIGIAWPDVADPLSLSPKDAGQPMLRELGADVNFEG